MPEIPAPMTIAQHGRQSDPATVSRQDRDTVRQSPARLGDGPRHSDRGDAGRDAAERSAGALSGRNAERAPDFASPNLAGAAVDLELGDDRHHRPRALGIGDAAPGQGVPTAVGAWWWTRLPAGML